MDCERRAKPLKHTIVTSKRNRLKDETGVALLRGYENLNHLMNAKNWSESNCTSPFCVVKGCLLLPNTLNECLYMKLRSY